MLPFVKPLLRLVGVLTASVLLVILATAARVWWVARDDNHPRSDAIVVLGASQFDGRPSAVFRSRLDHARALYDQGVAPRVVVLGGGALGDRTTEGASGAAYLTARGVTSVAVGEGRDTLQSMRALDRVFQARSWHSAVLVTDPWHSLRSLRMAGDLGIRATSSPTRSGPSVRTRGTEVHYIARETGAYLYYRLFHRSSEAGPRAVSPV